METQRQFKIIKVYYDNELRRIKVYEEDNLASLREKIKGIFQLQYAYKLKQKDNEGDWITIHNDGDLQCALNYTLTGCRGKYCKLHVVETKKAREAPTSQRDDEKKISNKKDPSQTPHATIARTSDNPVKRPTYIRPSYPVTQYPVAPPETPPIPVESGFRPQIATPITTRDPWSCMTIAVTTDQLLGPNARTTNHRTNVESLRSQAESKNQVENEKARGKVTYTAWVGDLCPKVCGLHLKKLFKERFPSVVSARVVTCKKSGHAKYGFVEFKDKIERDKAVSEMDGAHFLSRKLSVRNAPSRNLSPDPFGGRRKPSPNSKRKGGRRRTQSGGDAKSLLGCLGSGVIGVSELRKDDRPVAVYKGQVAKKSWILQNSGDVQWPVMTHLIFTAGSIKPSNCEIVLPPLLPGKVAIVTADFEADDFGEFEAHFRVSDPRKERRFGEVLKVKIRVVEDLENEAEPRDGLEIFVKEQKNLVKVGFSDRELNQHLLSQTNGDFLTVIRWLEAEIGRNTSELKNPDEYSRT